MTLDQLYTRKAVLTQEHEGLSDRMTDLSLKIDHAGESLRLAKADFLIDPSNAKLTDALSKSQREFDNLVSQESESLHERNDVQLALETIVTRITSLEVKERQQIEEAVRLGLPEKIKQLEQTALDAFAELFAAKSLSGIKGGYPQLTVGNLLNLNRDIYGRLVESKKTSLTEELGNAA